MKTIEEKAWEILNDRMSCNCTDGITEFVLINMNGELHVYNNNIGLIPIIELTDDENYDFWSIDK